MAEQNQNQIEVVFKYRNGERIILTGQPGDRFVLDATTGAPALETPRKDNLDAAVAPDGDNDIDEGYVVGSQWFDTTADDAYVCLDNTDGAAVWKKTTP